MRCCFEETLCLPGYSSLAPPSPSVFFKGMEGSRLGIPVAHGEGFANFSSTGSLDSINANGLMAARYVDNRGNPTERYPFNPNSSPGGVTGLTTEDGRATIMMPIVNNIAFQKGISFIFSILLYDRSPYLFPGSIHSLCITSPPPSTTMLSPLMNEASSEHKKQMQVECSTFSSIRPRMGAALGRNHSQIRRPLMVNS